MPETGRVIMWAMHRDGSPSFRPCEASTFGVTAVTPNILDGSCCPGQAANGL